MKDAMIEIPFKKKKSHIRSKKKLKKARVKSLRKKIKSDLEFVPKYNRYSGYR